MFIRRIFIIKVLILIKILNAAHHEAWASKNDQILSHGYTDVLAFGTEELETHSKGQ